MVAFTRFLAVFGALTTLLLAPVLLPVGLLTVALTLGWRAYVLLAHWANDVLSEWLAELTERE